MAKPKRCTLLLLLWMFVVLAGGAKALPCRGEMGKINQESIVDTATLKALSELGLAPRLKDIKRMQGVVAIAKKIRAEMRNIKQLINSRKSFDLPLGKSRSIGDADFTISIDSLFLIPTGGQLCASALVKVPPTEKNIGFEGNRIGFDRGGFTGDARLMLIGNAPIPLNKNVILVFMGEEKRTYIDWDCNGYTGMGIQGQLLFNGELIHPADSTQKYARAFFETSITDFSDFVADVSMDPFGVKGLDGFVFNVKNATFDYSEIRNSSGMDFPVGYQSTSMPTPKSSLWEGFYLRELTVDLPSQFRKKNHLDPIRLSAKNVIIDEMGFTGEVRGKNLMNLKEGDLSGWDYSLEDLEVVLRYNKLQKGRFNGEMRLPISREHDLLGYEALIQPHDQYHLKVALKENMDFDLFKSEVTLEPSSYLKVNVENHRFQPKAVLHGYMIPKVSMLSIGDIIFEGLTLTTRQPFLDVERFSLGREGREKKLGGFPIQLNSITFEHRPANQYGLGLDMDINFSEQFGGIAEAIILSEKEPDAFKFKFAGLDVGKVGIDVDQGAFKLKGYAQWFKNDSRYGSGFKGLVDAQFTPGLRLQASALFGSVDNYRYWYADGLFSVSTGVPIFPGLFAYTFGGGICHRMKYAGAMNPENAQLPTASGVGSIGATPSGMVYLPDKEYGLGLKAMVDIASKDKSAITIETVFETSFNRHGGLNYISFEGNGKFLSPLKIPGTEAVLERCARLGESLKVNPGLINSSQGQNLSDIQVKLLGDRNKAASLSAMAAKAKVSYDFPNKTLHGTFDLYVNLPGDVIKGIGPNGRAGWSVLHYDPRDWYFYMGTPEDRMGVKLMKFVKTGSYFMAGTKVLDSPPPPDEVSDILGANDLDYMRDFNALGAGKGFAFGSNFSVSTGNLNFLIFYGHFDAGAGFDIMLKNYGQKVRCKGSGESPGINGWYANGQAYAYLDGEIGIKVKVFGKRKKFHILDIGAATLLQAQLPNPLWMKGVVGESYSVLGGLVKGRCKFEVEIGDKCEPVGGSVLDELEIISDVTPQSGTADVDVFSAFQTVFNMEVGKTFEMVDLDEVEKQFRVKLDEMSLKVGNQLIEGEIQWNDNYDVAIFNSLDILPPEKEVAYKVKVSFEEKIGGVWKRMKDQTQEVTGNFKTGKAPDYIPPSNVAYSYPLMSQFNFYKDEYNGGYIKLEKGQPYLFTPDEKWKQKMRMTQKEGGVLMGDISYSDRTVNFTIPQGLHTNAIYQLQLVNLPQFMAGELDANVEVLERGGDEATIRDRKARKGSTIATVEEKVLFESYFRTSIYSTFKDKYAQIRYGESWEWPVHNGVYQAGVMMESEEAFGKFEMKGGTGYAPLLQFVAQQNNRWFRRGLNTMLYSEYPLDGKYTIDWRDPKVLGTPPVRAVGISQNIKMPLIKASHFTGEDPPYHNRILNLTYNLAAVAFDDFKDLRTKVARASLQSPTVRLGNLLNNPFPVQIRGRYEVQVQYVLPGINRVTFTTKTAVPYLMN